jgi:hypothetical protein
MKYVLVSDSVLQLVRNALKRDAEKGLVIRQEILDELDQQTFRADTPEELLELIKIKEGKKHADGH